MVNVFITTAGSTSGVNCINALRNQDELKIKIVASDLNKYVAGLYLADKYYLVPPFSPEIAYLEAIINICKTEKIDVVLPAFSSDVYLFSRYETELKNNGVNFLVPSFKTVDLFRDKWKSYNFFRDINIPTPDTQQLTLINGGTFKFPIFIKPVLGSGSKNAFKIDNDQELDFFKTQIGSNQYISQPYIQAPEFTVDILVGTSNQIICLVARQRLKTKGGIAVASQTVDSAPIMPVIQRIFSNIEFKGPINLQYFLQDNTFPIIFDVNTRFAAGGLPLAIKAGLNIPLETVKLALGLPTKIFQGYERGITMLRYYTEIFITDEDNKL